MFALRSCARSCLRSTLLDAVRGSSRTTCTARARKSGFKAVLSAALKALSRATSVPPASAGALSSTTAKMTSASGPPLPLRLSAPEGTLIAAVSRTRELASLHTRSISTADTLMPPRFIVSSTRPLCWMYPPPILATASPCLRRTGLASATRGISAKYSLSWSRLRRREELPRNGGSSASSPSTCSSGWRRSTWRRRLSGCSWRSTRCAPRVGVAKHEGTAGTSIDEHRNPPPISVPPQYSMSGRYARTRDMSHIASSGEDASPVEEKQRMAERSTPASAPPDLHACTIAGTTPKHVTPARDTNVANPRSSGDPSNSAAAAPFNSDAYTSHGPIIHPKLVGHARTSRCRMSWCAHASTAHRIGVTCDHGMAFGSPVVPLEKRMLVTAPDGAMCGRGGEAR
mmetsp:Transcript_22944/g.74750  ORF Transcript_22944/g.74750 Transcript_22944/m.74750 type:complete len:400 (-) Transcript_22944:1046-2245(-)